MGIEPLLVAQITVLDNHLIKQIKKVAEGMC